MAESLAERAGAALEGLHRRRRGGQHRDPDDSDESLFDKALPAGASRRVHCLVRSEPGAPMSADLKQIREYLAQRGGAADYNELDSQSARAA
eukprot:872134-Pyramimonas_sp.AAC.1